MYELILNKTGINIIDDFNVEYATQAIEICPLIREFQILVLYYNQSKHKKQLCLKKYDAFGYYISDEDGQASSTYAEIAINEHALNELSLMPQEILAALAHEIGHIMLFFNTKREQYKGQGIEVYCDQIACRIGLAKPLKSLLEKLLQNEHLPHELIQQIKNRIQFIVF